mgnify:CR=1 FL=1
MYTIIDEYSQGILLKPTEVNTNYKTVDRKIKLLAIPLLEDSWQKIKDDVNGPSFGDPKAIGHTFTNETKGNLRIGKKGFLISDG